MLETHTCRMEKMETDIANISSESVSQRQLQSCELSQLEQTVSKQIADTVRWIETQRAHVELLSSAGQRLQNLENGQSEFRAFTDNAEMQLSGLAAWQQDTAKDIEVHSIAIEAAQADLSKAAKGVDSAVEGLQGLKVELSAERDSLAKLGTRVDQCYKYFNGFGKGLQETSRQILSADSGMLPPKVGGGCAAMLPLPALPTAPKAQKVPTLPTAPRSSTPKGRLSSPRGPRPITVT